MQRAGTLTGLLLAAGCLFMAVASESQQQESKPADVPRLEQGPCDPPISMVTFGRKSDANVSKRVKTLFDKDQDRESSASRGKNWTTIDSEDRVRQREVMGYLQQGEINSGDDLYHAAMIFQHGNCTEHYKLANQLAEKAIAKGNDAAKWLYAATLDRYLMHQGKPQKFGTQFLRDGRGGKWQLYPVDPATTDEDRARYNVPALAIQKQKVEKLNQPSQN